VALFFGEHEKRWWRCYRALLVRMVPGALHLTVATPGEFLQQLADALKEGD
jgi:hypothetical protein